MLKTGTTVYSMTAQKEKNSGFTIIELIIVLALVWLVFIIVFFAVPALQRNARNNQRRNDAGKTIAYVKEITAARLNKLPGSCNNKQSSCFVRDVKMNYYDNQSHSENNVSFWNRSGIGPFDDAADAQLDPTSLNATERVSIRSYTKCNGEMLTGVDAGRFDIAAQFAVETRTGAVVQCVEF